MDRSIHVPESLLIVLLFLFSVLKFTHYVHVITVFFDLVSATIAEITVRCTVEVIHIERAAVSHLNVCGPLTTA